MILFEMVTSRHKDIHIFKRRPFLFVLGYFLLQQQTSLGQEATLYERG
jgi:hypothetical protein